MIDAWHALPWGLQNLIKRAQRLPECLVLGTLHLGAGAPAPVPSLCPYTGGRRGGAIAILAAYLFFLFGIILDKLQGKVVAHSEEIELWRILMVDCVKS